MYIFIYAVLVALINFGGVFSFVSVVVIVFVCLVRFFLPQPCARKSSAISIESVILSHYIPKGSSYPEGQPMS